MTNAYDSVPFGAIDPDAYDPDGRPVSGDGEEHSGQVRMAYRLARSHRDRLIHVHGIGWMHWDGRRWATDHSGHARRAVLEVLKTALTDSLGDKQLRQDVTKCESAGGIEGVLSIAAALVEFAVTVDDLDADPHLLNCANGTLDLRTRSLRAHSPADRLTRVTTGAYSAIADSPVWDAFLAQVLPDDDERAYLQRVVGQAVYGRVREHLFPVLIGTGANGKGTAYGAMVHALGDYATVINPDMLMTRERGGIGGPEMMTLLGARLVIGSETEEGRKLDEATMKRLTGGDKLTARNLYQPPVTWWPSHQLVYVTNALPKVKGNDPAAWRRIRVVPFDVVISPEDRDPQLTETLQLHADAVLSWIISGHFDYEDGGGMREPASVLHATDAYKADSDAVARFIDDRCVVLRNVSARTRQLFAAWQSWQISDGAERLSEKAFGSELDRLGFEARKTPAGMLREGIGLAVDDESEAPHAG
jgi:putative DNA primase/helicase